MTMPFRPRWYFFIALVSVTFIGPLSLHLFIPAIPAVKEAFGVSTGMAQLTMSLAMLSMAFFTVAYGGLSYATSCTRASRNRSSRRPS